VTQTSVTTHALARARYHTNVHVSRVGRGRRRNYTAGMPITCLRMLTRIAAPLFLLACDARAAQEGTAPTETKPHHHKEHKRESTANDAISTPSGTLAASNSRFAWYATLHDTGATDASTGTETVLGFTIDGASLGAAIGPAPASVGTLQDLRGLLPLADGSLLVIAAWKSNTKILHYGAPSADGVRPYLQVFTEGSASNPLLVHPYCIAVGPDGSIYASNQDSNTVTRYGAIGSPIAGQPLGLDGAPNGGTNAAGLVVPSAAMSQSSTSDEHASHGSKHGKKADEKSDENIGIKEVRGIAFGPDGKLYVADRGAGEVSRWNIETGRREAILLSKKDGIETPIQLLFSADGAFLFVSDNKRNEVFRLTLADNTVLTLIGADAGIDASSALAIDDGWLYVGSRKARAILRFQLADGSADTKPFIADLPDNPEFFIRNRN
jgi:hypothetical protein